MSIPTKHHFLPKFYLEKWALHNEQVVQWRKIGSEIRDRLKSPSGTGYQPKLYSLQTSNPQKEAYIETDIMSKQIDNPAAEAMQILITSGVNALTSTQRSAWTHFLMSLKVRGPLVVGPLKSIMKDALLKVIEEGQSEYDQWKPQAAEANLPHSVVDYLNQKDPHYLDNAGLKAMLDVISSPRVGYDLYNMHWEIITLGNTKRNFLTCDNLPIFQGNFDDPKRFFWLPITPRKLFVGSVDLKTIKDIKRAIIKSGILAVHVNEQIVHEAHQTIYSADYAEENLIKRYFTGEKKPNYPWMKGGDELTRTK